MPNGRKLLCALCGYPRSGHQGKTEVCPIDPHFRLRRDDTCGATNGRRGRCGNIATHACTIRQVRRGGVRTAIVHRCKEHLTGVEQRELGEALVTSPSLSEVAK